MRYGSDQGLISLRRWVAQYVILVSFFWTMQSVVGQQSPVQEAGQQPQPGAVNLEYSRVYVFADKTGVMGHQHAVEGRLKAGQLYLDKDSNGSLVFDMKSFDADGAEARKYLGFTGTTDDATRKKVNDNLLGDAVLAVNRFPESTLSNATLKSTGGLSSRKLPEAVLEGDFTLHGVTRHVTIRCDVEPKDGWHHVRGAFKIKQSDYGIKPFAIMMGAVGVKDELLIVGDLWVVPAP